MARRTGLGVTTMVAAATVDASTALVIMLRCARHANAAAPPRGGTGGRGNHDRKAPQQRLPQHRPARSVEPDRNPSADGRRHSDGAWTACRAAVALGYQVTLLSDAHSTFDSPVLTAEQIVAHHNSTLGDGFVALSRTDEVMFGSE
jgi:hypothetical protein